MKIYFNSDFIITKREYEEYYLGSEYHNKIEVYFPMTTYGNYTYIYPVFNVKRPDDRKFGEFALTEYNVENDYIIWRADLPSKALEVEGTLEITILFKYSTDNKYAKVSTGKVLLNVKEAVVSESNIIYVGEETNFLSEIDAIRNEYGDRLNQIDDCLKNGDNKPDTNIFAVYNSLNIYGKDYARGLSVQENNTGIFDNGSSIYLRNNDVSINNKSFNKLYEQVQLIAGNYDLIRPSFGTTYTRTIDTIVEKYIYISEVGGMSYKSTNIYDKNTEVVNSTTYNGVFQTSTKTNRTPYISIIPNTKYAFSIDVNDANARYIAWYDIDKKFISQDIHSANTLSHVFTTPNTARYCIYSYLNQATKVQITESSSVLPYEEYFSGIRHTPVSEIKLNEETIINLNEVYSMEGYGVGINENCYNYLDFDKDVLVKRVVSYTFNGTETIAAAGTNKSGKSRFFVSFLENVVKKPESDNEQGNILMKELDTITNAQATNNIEGVCIAASGKIVFYVNDITDGGVMLNYLKGKTIYYELLEPIENALPQINTFIEAKQGDVITFENQYQKGVPSTIKYIEVV